MTSNAVTGETCVSQSAEARRAPTDRGSARPFNEERFDAMQQRWRVLASFKRSPVLHRHYQLSGLSYTEGVRFLAEHTNGWWLIDFIVLFQPAILRAYRPYLQVWELCVQRDGAGTLECLPDAREVGFRQRFDCSDSLLDYVKLYVQERVILLPSEHRIAP